jgi:GNAT superfamily N-acetyltransferase
MSQPLPFHIRLMTEDDVPEGLRLSGQNGWNQLAADWQRFLAMQPDGCFLAELEGRLIGTACGCIFGSVAWVALVLVDPAYRQQGIGTALMHRVLEFLEAEQVPTIRLDATPMGQPIYEKLGFVAEYSLVRYEGVLPATAVVEGVESATAADVDAICRLDAEIHQTDRRKFLERLFAENPEAMRVVRGGDQILGYAGARPGARAVQIGPCLGGVDAGRMLLADALQRHAGKAVFIDIPVSHENAIALARQQGLTVQRHLLRMWRGRKVEEQAERIWAGSGPEKG